jgi:hypothetical protein
MQSLHKTYHDAMRFLHSNTEIIIKSVFLVEAYGRWLRRYATSRKVEGSSLYEVTEFFQFV